MNLPVCLLNWTIFLEDNIFVIPTDINTRFLFQLVKCVLMTMISCIWWQPWIGGTSVFLAMVVGQWWQGRYKWWWWRGFSVDLAIVPHLSKVNMFTAQIKWFFIDHGMHKTFSRKWFWWNQTEHKWFKTVMLTWNYVGLQVFQGFAHWILSQQERLGLSDSFVIHPHLQNLVNPWISKQKLGRLL